MCAKSIGELEAKVQTAKEKLDEVHKLLLEYAKYINSMPKCPKLGGAYAGRLKTEFKPMPRAPKLPLKGK